MTQTTVASIPSPWLKSPGFDLTLFFGGAALGALAAIAVIALSVPVPIVWWIWLLGVDGPHMMATYSRTYLDKTTWRDRPRLLLLSLAAFAAGPLAIAAGLAVGSDGPFFAFLAIATAYGYHHVVRQHWGFLALYRARGRDHGRAGFLIDKWGLYLGSWAPYFGFLVTHEKTRPLMGLAPSAPPWLAWPFMAIWGLATVAMITSGLVSGSRVKTAYAAVVLVLHGAAYFVVGRFEPVYSASSGPDEDFLLLSVMLSTFHASQYVALVYLHNRSRFGDGGAGAASWISSSVARFALVCGLFTLAYLAMASSAGVFPVIRSFVGAKIGDVSINRVALSLWWGLALHHYVLDQKIWRIKDDPELRRHLGLAS